MLIKKQKLIEGIYPNIIIASHIANLTGIRTNI